MAISIHAPRGGSDADRQIMLHKIEDFNPRSPWGERLCGRYFEIAVHKFQSTLPVGGATHTSVNAWATSGISIHAPRGGSDSFCQYGYGARTISIHAPRGGSDSTAL